MCLLKPPCGVVWCGPMILNVSLSISDKSWGYNIGIFSCEPYKAGPWRENRHHNITTTSLTATSIVTAAAPSQHCCRPVPENFTASYRPRVPPSASSFARDLSSIACVLIWQETPPDCNQPVQPNPGSSFFLVVDSSPSECHVLSHHPQSTPQLTVIILSLYPSVLVTRLLLPTSSPHSSMSPRSELGNIVSPRLGGNGDTVTPLYSGRRHGGVGGRVGRWGWG
ncbi:hypothetical protein Salat_2447600 [Sesamum alatum]|uniref:Uncharacterized protein n=1 Tax=Sesamum alatum TaxID=300844 RepID=A0AAE1XRI5_9LAMI|nr:hypothetical protein Salat_2447600 [Sesamum alatum]